MKNTICLILLLSLSAVSYSQTSTDLHKHVSESDSNGSGDAGQSHWNIDNYIWSHSHHDSSLTNKPIINFKAIDNWTGLGEHVSISRDGSFFAYTRTKGTSYYKKVDSLIIQSTTGSWRQAINTEKFGFFSGDSKQYIFQDEGRLCFLQVGTGNRRYVEDVESFFLPNKGRNDWFLYRLRDSTSTIILHDLITGYDQRWSGVGAYRFDEQLKWFSCQLNNERRELVIFNLATRNESRFSDVLTSKFSENGNSMLLTTSQNCLKFLNLTTQKISSIWSGEKDGDNLLSLSFDTGGKQVVFTVNEQQTQENSIWYWCDSMNKGVMKVSNRSATIRSGGLSIGEEAYFTENGKYIQFDIRPRVFEPQTFPDAVRLDVWSYKDSLLQCTQQLQSKQRQNFTAILNLDNDLVIRLTADYEKLDNWIPGDFAVVVTQKYGDRFWEYNYGMDSVWVVSLQTGHRKLLPVRKSGSNLFSPDGKWLVYFDSEKGCNYFSYDLYTGDIVNISSTSSSYIFGLHQYHLHTARRPVNPAGRGLIEAWIGNDGIIVSDDYDIWRLDITGKRKPINLTNGYGRKHYIKFELCGSGINIKLADNDTLLLKAFNRKTKYNGYFRKVAGSIGKPDLLYMGPCFMVESINYVNKLSTSSISPMKAADANVWLLCKETAAEAPNYFLTYDFKSYKQLSWLMPEKAFNFHSAELHNFKQLDGTYSQGVMYKPENFDPKKKYPVIISFYTDLSDNLYQYAPPGYGWGPMIHGSPSWMVSHGYLVFAPDIYFTKDKWGPSTLNTIDGAAKYLGSLPFVDRNHLAAVGHSNSGRFGYYLLTHSRHFTAMCLGSATADLINSSLYIIHGKSNLEWTEESAVGTGLGPVFQNKKSWLDHTSSVHADKVYSALLLFHNRNDAVPLEWGSEMYIALRRMEKKCWWLQYDDGGHILSQLRDLRDFTIRYTQYFDHFLKGAPPPRWMTQGIPAPLKAVTSRYELDPTGSCAIKGKNICNVCDVWNTQYDRNIAMFDNPISKWCLDNDLQDLLDRRETERRKNNLKGEEKRIKENNKKLKEGYHESRDGL